MDFTETVDIRSTGAFCQGGPKRLANEKNLTDRIESISASLALLQFCRPLHVTPRTDYLH